MREFKYRASFASNIRCLVNDERDHFLAKASLDSLKSIIPDEVKDQSDLLAIAFNICTPNLGNKNGDMIDNNTAIQMYKGFINRPINIEHERVASIGHIVSASFSEFSGDFALGAGSKIIEASTIKDKKEPFNIALSAVLYRLYNKQVIDEIEASANPNSDKYLAYSASWELAFDTYVLAVGSQYLTECDIITDPVKIEEMSKYLIGEGGTGKTPEGRPIFRLISGDILPLGMGITESPAAFVAGIVTDGKTTLESKSAEVVIPIPNNIKEKNEDSNSQLEKSSVNANTINDLKPEVMIKTIKDITDENLKQAKAADITSILDAEINRISQEWENKQNQSDTDKKAAEAKAKELEEKFSKSSDELSKFQADLTKLVEANKKRDEEEAFSARMEYFAGEFELDEKTKDVIANKIKGLDEAGYTSEKESLEVLLAAKKKGFVPFKKTDKADCKEDMMKKDVKASVETGKETATAIETSTENGKITTTTVAATTTATETQADKWKNSFGIGQWEINPRHVRK
jgi:hypothetical protein